ncbi:MAG: hypothetical protein KDJ44_19285 [Rhodoblastus sp.]|nr:hypothetical protein [Rhodoblastus sp.]
MSDKTRNSAVVSKFPVRERPPRPPGFIVKHLLMPQFGITSDALAERCMLTPQELDRFFAGDLQLDKALLSKLRRVFGKAALPLPRAQRLYNFYAATGSIHPGIGQIPLPKAAE